MQGTGEANQMEGGAVANAAFNPAHVAAADLRDVRKCLLRKVLLLAQLSDSHAETLEGRMSGRLTGLSRHGANAGASRSFGPRPIGYNHVAER